MILDNFSKRMVSAKFNDNKNIS